MAKKDKTPGELLQDKLAFKPENSGNLMSDEEIAGAIAFCEDYKTFLDASKTERACSDWVITLLKKKGYKPFNPDKTYKPGDKVYLANRGKAVILAAIGKRPLADGVKILASHIDSPRVDLKQRPLYEEAQLAMFKTHYYGGIRKHQWVATPLALHGVIIKKDGKPVNVVIGEDAGDPVFVINDLLPHLAKDQDKRTLSEGIKGEELNVLVGSLPFKDDKASEKVKLNILRLLSEKYAIVEEDFLSAELCLVPAQKAKDVGLDRSMVGGYGHDDRVCAYTSLIASLETPTPDYTWVNVLADKEETGSEGNTGLASRFLENFILDLAGGQKTEGRRVFEASECLSADVNGAFDPTFPEVNDKKNCAYIGYGAVMSKYTGARGKAGTNDASAEFVGKIRRLFDQSGVHWQTAELGKVDMGGGGTVAKFISNLGADVVDIGVPVLSMHAPFEVVGKLDVYNTYKGFLAFISQK
ncbi:MAG: aminopeptidase [Oscillospiraceae bacterium]|nr:aminopeptidase [Oscillospiraceae bacterium]